MGEQQITKKQHYVPRTYLRGFSPDPKRIWSYSLDPMDSGKLVPIESVCRVNFLYEVKDESGNLIAPNWIEKILGGLEGMFATNLRALEKKAFHRENYQTQCFFTTEEKAFWKTFIAVQIMRDPKVIQEAVNVTNDFFGNQLSQNKIQAFAMSQCLPFFNEMKPEDKTAFVFFVKPLLDMKIALGVDEGGTIFTSDKPVYCYSSHRDNLSDATEYDKIVLPLTPKLVLILLGGEAAKKYDRNRLFPLNPEDLDSVKRTTAYNARSRIFSQNALTENDRTIIEQARRDRKEDEAPQPAWTGKQDCGERTRPSQEGSAH